MTSYQDQLSFVSHTPQQSFSQYFDCWVLENGFSTTTSQRCRPAKETGGDCIFSKSSWFFTGRKNQESPEHTLGHRLAWTRLLSIVEEQARTTLRNAFSTLLRECRAVGCAVLSASGELLAHSETSSPSLTGVLLLEVQAGLASRFAKSFRGGMYDPHQGRLYATTF